jgi:hypothetical protein
MQEPAVSDIQWRRVSRFYDSLDAIVREYCVRCHEFWFDMKLKDGVCYRCQRLRQGRPARSFTAIDLVPEHLPQLSEIEEMLIARIHVHIQVWQVKGQQYKYKGHVVNFMQNTSKLYTKLPLLTSQLDVGCLSSCSVRFGRMLILLDCLA